MSDTKQISAGNQPFGTTDRELALALLTAGCKWAAVEDGGPAQMHYTPDVCRDRWVTQRHGSTGHPTRIPLLSHYPQTPEQFERSVMLAVKLKIPGVTTYFIEKDATFKEAMAMHDKLVAEAHLAGLQKRPIAIPALAGLTEAEAAMVICYVRRMNEKDMASYAWVRPPNLCIGEVSKKTIPKHGAGEKVLEQVSYKAEGAGLTIWSLDLPDSERSKIMSDSKPFIHPKPKL
jgi:hypothetical protein